MDIMLAVLSHLKSQAHDRCKKLATATDACVMLAIAPDTQREHSNFCTFKVQAAVSMFQAYQAIACVKRKY